MKEAGAESLSFQLLNRNVDQPFKYVATWLIDEWSKIGLHVTQRVVPDGPSGSTQCAAEISTYTTVALRRRRNAPALRSTPDRRRMRSDNRTAIGSRRWPLQSPSSQSRDPLLFRAPWKGVLRWPRSRARGRPRMPPIYSVAVGDRVAPAPPRRSRRAAFPHRAPAKGRTRLRFGALAAHAPPIRRLAASVTRRIRH